MDRMDREDSSRDYNSQGDSWSDKAQENLPRVASMSDSEAKHRDYPAICVFCLALMIFYASG